MRIQEKHPLCQLARTLALLLLLAVTHAGAQQPPSSPSASARACRNDDCSFATVRQALDEARDGDTLRILPGVHRDGGVLRAHGVTVRAEGAHLKGVAFEEKAALVIQGDDATVVGLECSDVRVADMNGACIRAEGRNLTLRNVYFHDAQTGLLGGPEGRLLIEDSVIERMGELEGGPSNPHGLYVGYADELVLRRSRVLGSVGEGHEVKSRARRTLIEGCVIASLEGDDSRLIDLPNGGEIVIRGNVLQKGPNSANEDVIGIGLERGRDPARDHADNESRIEANLVLLDGRGRSSLVRSRGVPEPMVRDNVLVGGRGPVRREGIWYRSRDAAGLPPFPYLPEPEETAPPNVRSGRAGPRVSAPLRKKMGTGPIN